METERLLWELFNKTGNPSYYMLYKAVKEGEERDI